MERGHNEAINSFRRKLGDQTAKDSRLRLPGEYRLRFRYTNFEETKMKRKTPKIMRALLVLLFAVVALSAQEQPSCPVKVSLLQVNDVYQFAPVDGGARGG